MEDWKRGNLRILECWIRELGKQNGKLWVVTFVLKYVSAGTNSEIHVSLINILLIPKNWWSRDGGVGMDMTTLPGLRRKSKRKSQRGRSLQDVSLYTFLLSAGLA